MSSSRRATQRNATPGFSQMDCHSPSPCRGSFIQNNTRHATPRHRRTSHQHTVIFYGVLWPWLAIKKGYTFFNGPHRNGFTPWIVWPPPLNRYRCDDLLLFLFWGSAVNLNRGGLDRFKWTAFGFRRCGSRVQHFERNSLQETQHTTQEFICRRGLLVMIGEVVGGGRTPKRGNNHDDRVLHIIRAYKNVATYAIYSSILRSTINRAECSVSSLT